MAGGIMSLTIYPVGRMFDLDETDGCPSLSCPFLYNYVKCDGIPHMRGTVFGRGIPESSTSGPGLIIELICENGHHWKLCFEDHSGGTWLSIVRLPDEPDTF
jgi:hypothetical protein